MGLFKPNIGKLEVKRDIAGLMKALHQVEKDKTRWPAKLQQN